MNQFDLVSELERVTSLGYSPNVIYDDNGYFAISDEGISSVREGDDFTIEHFCQAGWFKSTPQEAWEFYLKRMKDNGYDDIDQEVVCKQQ